MSEQTLKAVGLKTTLPRVKILNILSRSEQRHLSAESIHESLLQDGIEMGFATVYRVLAQFEKAGLIKRHRFEGGHGVYELDEGAHHDHLICIYCGFVEEFLDPVIETRQIEVARHHNFKMADHQLTIYGTCQSCQQTVGNPPQK